MRVFVAGAGGAVGLPLIEQLVAAGHEVIGMTRSPDRGRAIRALGAQTVLCDALLAGLVMSAVARTQPDAVIHELTNIPPRPEKPKYALDFTATNRLRTEGTHNLLAAVRAAGVKRVIAHSVAFAYAPTGDWVKTEEAPLASDARPPMDKVIAAVAELERRLLEDGGIVLRYGYFYGPRTQFSLKGFYAELARKRQLPIIGSGEGHWSFIHVADAAAATVAALQSGSPGVYNVVDDDPAPAREWVPVYAAAVDGKRPLRVPEAIGARLAGPMLVEAMTRQRGASNAKARHDLGWSPGHASWREGFPSAVAEENRERWRWVRR